MTPSQIRQERIRLFASFLNIASAACLVAATVTQPFLWLTSGLDHMTEATFGLISLSLAVLLHLGAQAVLREALNMAFEVVIDLVFASLTLAVAAVGYAIVVWTDPKRKRRSGDCAVGPAGDRFDHIVP